MFKIDSTGATVANEFQDDSIALGIPGTVLSAEYLNMLQRELNAVVAASGAALNKANDHQLRDAIQTLIAAGGGGGGGGGGSVYWADPVATSSALPAGKPAGTIALVTGTTVLWRYNGSAWVSFIDVGALTSAIAAKISSTEKGAALGVATLDSGGKVPSSQLPASLTGAMVYRGVLDASGAAYPSSPLKGDYYVISGAGTISGHAYLIGDWAVYDGTSWDYIDNSNKVSSVNGLTGAVVLAKSNVGLANVDNTSDVNKPVSTAQAAADALAIPLTQKGAASGVVPLDASSLIPTAYLPPLAVVKYTPVANQAARLALTAESGDGAIQADNGKTYVLKFGGSASTNADWLEITAGGAVTTVDGQTGTVSLATTYQALDGDLTAISAISSNGVLRRTGVNTWATVPALPIAEGGTGQITAVAALAALLPAMTGNAGKFLTTDATTPSWASIQQAKIPVLQTASFTAASNSTNQIDHTAGGIVVGTLPSTSLAVSVTFCYAKGAVDSTTNFFRAIANPAGGTDTIDGNAFGDTEDFTYPLYAVTYSKAAGASVWYGEYQMLSTVQGGQVPSNQTGSAIAYPNAGHVRQSTPSNTVGSNTVSTWTAITGGSLTLDPGEWDIESMQTIGLIGGSGTSPNFRIGWSRIYNVTDAVSIQSVYAGSAEGSKVSDIAQATHNTSIIVPFGQTKTIRLEVSSNEANSATTITNLFGAYSGSGYIKARLK